MTSRKKRLHCCVRCYDWMREEACAPFMNGTKDRAYACYVNLAEVYMATTYRIYGVGPPDRFVGQRPIMTTFMLGPRLELVDAQR